MRQQAGRYGRYRDGPPLVVVTHGGKRVGDRKMGGSVRRFTNADLVLALEIAPDQARPGRPMEIPETHQDRASRYRHTAARLRQQADPLDGRERRELLEIADQYDRLANRLTRARAEAEEVEAM